MGWDSFGLNAENAAIRNNEHPATYTYANIDTQFASFKKYGVAVDWSRRFNTSDPEYYRWTQWLFLRFRERGLAYRKNSPVNWCPNDQTVLANEQVVDGRCERCGAEVTKRELTQWYFKITDYAQELLDNLDDLAPTWPDRVITAQRNWIGRSEGAHVDFPVVGGGRVANDPGLHDPARHVVRRDVHGGGGRRRPGQGAGHRRAAAGVRGLPGRGPQVLRDRPDVHRATQVGRVPGRARAQPGQRRRDPGLRRRLRAARLRHRRDHGRAGPGPARLGLREGLRAAHRADGPAARGLGRRGLHRRRAGDRVVQQRGRPERADGRRRQGRDHRLAGAEGVRHPRRQLPVAGLAAEPPALLGSPHSHRPLRERAERSPYRTTSCPWCCPTCAAPT